MSLTSDDESLCSEDIHIMIEHYVLVLDYIVSGRGQNLKEIINRHGDINVVEDNERISKWIHLFKLSQPFSRYRSSKLRFMMRNSDKFRLFFQQISRRNMKKYEETGIKYNITPGN